MQLRPYQSEAIQAINKLQGKTNKQVAVLATGLGKTVIFSHLISQRLKDTDKKALILAHREELLEQAQDKLSKVDDGLSVAIEQADRRTDGEQVVVASVQTLGRAGSERIKKFNPEDFNTIIVDEAHHASASTYQNILDHFGVLKNKNDWNKNILLLGVTATPNRNDNQGIDQIFDETAFTYGILEGIQDGWLSRIRAFRIDTRTDLQNIHTRAGDFAQDELADAINNEERNKLIVKTYLELLGDKQALVFSASVQHALDLSGVFSKNGIPTGVVLGETPKDERRQLLQDFHAKKLRVMVNAMVLTEGYDNETIDAVMMARPTQSGILYQQMIGRGTRTHKDKPYLTVVDFVDNTYRHQLKTASSLLGVEGKVNFRGNDILDVKNDIDRVKELNPNFNLDRLDMDRIKYIMEEVDLMSGIGKPEEVNSMTEFAWHRYGIDRYRISIGDQRYFIVEGTVTGQYNVYFDVYDTITKKSYRDNLGECKTLEEAIKRTDKYIFNNYKETLRLVSLRAAWRNEPMTEKQRDFLRRMKGKYNITDELIDNLDKGTASDLMTKIMTLNEGRRL